MDGRNRVKTTCEGAIQSNVVWHNEVFLVAVQLLCGGFSNSLTFIAVRKALIFSWLATGPKDEGLEEVFFS